NATVLSNATAYNPYGQAQNCFIPSVNQTFYLILLYQKIKSKTAFGMNGIKSGTDGKMCCNTIDR
ncbi:MAG: hypothetical protein RR841_07775, partial [Eubacterium sp.]